MGGPLFDQTDETAMPKIRSEQGRHALLVDGEPFFIFGAQAHNSSAWPAIRLGRTTFWPRADGFADGINLTLIVCVFSIRKMPV